MFGFSWDRDGGDDDSAVRVGSLAKRGEGFGGLNYSDRDGDGVREIGFGIPGVAQVESEHLGQAWNWATSWL